MVKQWFSNHVPARLQQVLSVLGLAEEQIYTTKTGLFSILSQS